MVRTEHHMSLHRLNYLHSLIKKIMQGHIELRIWDNKMNCALPLKNCASSSRTHRSWFHSQFFCFSELFCCTVYQLKETFQYVYTHNIFMKPSFCMINQGGASTRVNDVTKTSDDPKRNFWNLTYLGKLWISVYWFWNFKGTSNISNVILSEQAFFWCEVWIKNFRLFPSCSFIPNVNTYIQNTFQPSL